MLIENPPVELADRLWMLGSAAYPFYLFRGAGGSTIFEGGAGAMGPVLKRQLDDLGIGAGDVRQIVVTHAHPDHVMAVPLLKRLFPAASVVASEAAARTLASEKAVELFRKLDETLTGSLVKAGLAAEGTGAEPLPENRIAIDRTAKEGDAIEVDQGVAYAVLETPGHSECSLSFFEPGGKVLILSDATGYYMPQSQSWWPNYFSGYGAYVDSMERLAGLGAELVCLSHNGAVRGAEAVAEYFRGAIEATRAYHERIVAETKAGKPVREIAEMLGAEIYDKTPLLPLDFFQKNCGLLVKQSLKHEEARRSDE